MLRMSDLEGIVDARRGQGRMYDLPHVLLCCILAVAAGADSYRAMVRFIDARLGWLREHTGLAWRRAPTHTGLRAVLLGLDQAGVKQALRRCAGEAVAGEERVTVAIDGKTLRGKSGPVCRPGGVAMAVGVCHRAASGPRPSGLGRG